MTGGIVKAMYDEVMLVPLTELERGTRSVHEMRLRPGLPGARRVLFEFTQTLIAINGILGISMKGRTVFLLPGEKFTIRKGQSYSFFNPENEEIRVRMIMRPIHPEMDAVLKICKGLSADGLMDPSGCPRNRSVAAVIMDLSRSFPAGAGILLIPFIKFIARRARTRGVEAKLRMRYCQ